MTLLVTNRLLAERRPAADRAPAATTIAAGDPDGAGQGGSSPDASTPSEALLQDAIRERLLRVLDGWIAEACRTIIETRLAAAQPSARTALLPSDEKRRDMAGDLLVRPDLAMIATLLSPAIDAELRLLVELARGSDPMAREASIDRLSGAADDGSVRNRVRVLCESMLAPGLSLLGAAPAGGVDRDAVPTRPAIPPAAQESDFLECLRSGDAGGAMTALAAHAGIAQGRIAEAVRTRDARSLFSLAWRAGYSLRAAKLLQTQLAGIPPWSLIGPSDRGAAVMGRGEIAWQLALLETV